MALASAIPVLAAGPALAHTEAGGVVVVEPDPEATVASPVEVVLSGEAIPAGAAPVEVRLFLDGQAVDPTSGRLGGDPAPLRLGAGEEHTVAVEDVEPGGHVLSAEVVAGTGGTPEVAEVPFTVTSGAGRSPAFFVILAILVALLILSRRRLRPRPKRSEGTGEGS